MTLAGIRDSVVRMSKSLSLSIARGLSARADYLYNRLLISLTGLATLLWAGGVGCFLSVQTSPVPLSAYLVTLAVSGVLLCLHIIQTWNVRMSYAELQDRADSIMQSHAESQGQLYLVQTRHTDSDAHEQRSAIFVVATDEEAAKRTAREVCLHHQIDVTYDSVERVHDDAQLVPGW